MPNRETHAELGILAGAGIYLLSKKSQKEIPTQRGVLTSSLIGLSLGILPDLLEPATNPNHRKFCHSGTFLLILLVGAKKIYENPNIKPEVKQALLAGVASYSSHLLADSTTPKGIPLI